VASQSKLRYSVSNFTFKLDWDLVKSIVRTVCASQLRVTYEQDQGHQDNETPTAELDLLAQLNVEAGQYAREFRLLRGKYRPLIPLMPTCSVALDIGGKTVHRNFKPAIWDAIHGSTLLKEMHVRYNWPDGTLEFINWEAHCQSTQSSTDSFL
jgi:hypothetical protein